jgi:hypothetical protein
MRDEPTTDARALFDRRSTTSYSRMIRSTTNYRIRSS